MPVYYHCSNGERITQATIDKRRADCHRSKWAGEPHPMCGGCQEVKANDNDHTIAQRRCKHLHKTELIYDPNNNEPSCRKCHAEWEDVKGLKWVDHANVIPRMLYLKEHDPEGYAYRMNITT